MAESESGIRDIINKAEISLVLDTYDDIFSDFDPRPYNERALSEDFLAEAKKAARDKENGIELHLLIPKSKHNVPDEELIKQRLRNHFRKHFRRLKEEFSMRDRQAVVLIAIGVMIGLADALLLSSGFFSTIIQDAIEITFTPASWYTIWMGLDHLLVKPKEDASDERFYKKMIEAQITFTPY